VKKMTLPVAVFVAILGCVLAVSANVTTMQMHDHLKKERFRRIQAENKMQKMERDLMAIRQQASQSNDDLAQIQDILSKRDTEKSAMKEQLDQLTAQNQALVQELQGMQGGKQPVAAKPPKSEPKE